MTCSHMHFHQQSIHILHQYENKYTYHDVQSVQYADLVELTHSHLGLLTRHLGHLKPPRTFLTRHLFIDEHLLPSGSRALDPTTPILIY